MIMRPDLKYRPVSVVLWSAPLIFGIGRHRCKILDTVVLSGKVLGVAFVFRFCARACFNY